MIAGCTRIFNKLFFLVFNFFAKFFAVCTYLVACSISESFVRLTLLCLMALACVLEVP